MSTGEEGDALTCTHIGLVFSLWRPPYAIGQTIIFFALWFLLSFFFSHLISAVAD